MDKEIKTVQDDKKKCADCKFCINKQCTHKSNIGIILKYHREKEFYIKSLKDLNQKENCKNYVEFSE